MNRQSIAVVAPTLKDSPRRRASSPGLIARLGLTGRLVRFAFAIGPALISLVLGAAVYDGVRRAQESRALVSHTRDVIDRADAVLATLQDAETGQRGFLLTGEPRYLEPYNRAVGVLGADMATLRTLMRDNPRQQARLDLLTGVVRQKMDELAATVALRRMRGPDAVSAAVRTDRGKELMDRTRLVLATIVSAERISLETRQAEEARHARVVMIILIIGTVVSVLLALLLNGTLLRYANAETRLAHDLEMRNARLEEQGVELELQAQHVQDQAEALEVQNEELVAGSEALAQQATELELQTEELERANLALAETTRAAEAARAAAEMANRAKSDFLAMMSHELRTPLNAIAGYTQLMQLGVPEPATPAHQIYLARIQHSQHHLLGVINSVLNLARIEAGSVMYDIRDVELAALLAAVEPLVAPQLQARGHRFECLPCDGPLVVRADPDKVTQVLLNLLSNAIKFTPPGGVITLTVEAVLDEQGQEFAAVHVHDTGRGIPREKLDTIFDPFVQVDASLSRTTEGAGLGLAISRELARGMGGDLAVESVVGTGSTFTLTLPLFALIATA